MDLVIRNITSKYSGTYKCHYNGSVSGVVYDRKYKIIHKINDCRRQFVDKYVDGSVIHDWFLALVCIVVFLLSLAVVVLFISLNRMIGHECDDEHL